MENEPTFNEEYEALKISHEAETYLGETSRWALFLSIFGFIMIGLMVIGSFSISAAMSKFGGDQMPLPVPGILFSAIYLVFALIYFFPVFYLFKFSSNMRSALKENDNFDLDQAFRYLKSHYKFMGVLMAIILGLYALMAIGFIAGALFF